MKSTLLIIFLTLTFITRTWADGLYLIPTTEPELQAYALSEVRRAELKRVGADQYRLRYTLPWSLTGLRPQTLEFTGPLHELKMDGQEWKADCSDGVTVPDAFTQHLAQNGQDFTPEVLCFIQYDQNLTRQLEAMSSDVIRLMRRGLPSEEAMKRLQLRQDFMGDPLGFLGLEEIK
jgi:hypothetical protein